MNNLKFYVITNSLGNNPYLRDCLHSVDSQGLVSKPKHYVTIDSDSKNPFDDNIIEKKFNLFKLKVNEIKQGSARNHFEALQDIYVSEKDKENTIIVHLDGDDTFLTNYSLGEIAYFYQDPNILTTYGDYVSRQGSICRPMDIESNQIRQSIVSGKGWRFSHPRTFRLKMAKYVKEDHMKDKNGNWYTSAADVALMLPILENCKKENIKYTDQDLVYYRIHPNNDAKRDLYDQIRCVYDIIEKPKL